MAVTREEIVEALKEMPALELSELVKTRSLNSTLSSKASATTRSLLSRLSATSLVLA